jgi:hypothetical protein
VPSFLATVQDARSCDAEQFHNISQTPEWIIEFDLLNQIIIADDRAYRCPLTDLTLTTGRASSAGPRPRLSSIACVVRKLRGRVVINEIQLRSSRQSVSANVVDVEGVSGLPQKPAVRE